MLTVTVKEDGEIVLAGRFDASQVDTAREIFDRVSTTCRVNFQDLEYISSAGLGVLLKTQKRLSETGNSLVLTHITKFVRDVFRIARFDLVFRIEDSE
ncbi:MAG: anti-sigma-factor antagonist [Bacteroidetes bacterium]|jgi:anti-sigma B factor antagonist|nr:anti-sigma-factor antagonist [Bacteroidota bacterium]